MQILAEEVQEGDFADFGYNSDDEVSVEINRSSSSSSSSSSPRHFSPLMLVESLSRKTISYGTLPLEPVKLIVLKLDGSSIDIIVTKKATVGDLKQAVEAAFSHLSEEGTGKVSWSHVWGQFCLCFEDQKLLHDHDSIRLYGIQDGDQLQFIRHTSVSCNLGRQRSEKQASDSERPEASSSKSVSYDDTQKNGGKRKELGGYEDVGVDMKYRYSWFPFLRACFSYRSLEGSEVYYQELGTSSTSNSAGASPEVLEVTALIDCSR